MTLKNTGDLLQENTIKLEDLDPYFRHNSDTDIDVKMNTLDIPNTVDTILYDTRNSVKIPSKSYIDFIKKTLSDRNLSIENINIIFDILETAHNNRKKGRRGRNFSLDVYTIYYNIFNSRNPKLVLQRAVALLSKLEDFLKMNINIGNKYISGKNEYTSDIEILIGDILIIENFRICYGGILVTSSIERDGKKIGKKNTLAPYIKF